MHESAPSLPRPKPKELIDLQHEIVRQKAKNSFTPLSFKEDPSLMSEQQLKARFPRRFDMYVKALRTEQGSAKPMTTDELKKMDQWLGVLNSLDNYIEKHKDSVGDRTLYDRQFTVFEDLRNFLEQNKDPKGYVKLPTGAGKTVLFTEFIEAVNLKTLIVVPKKLLVDQTQEKFEEFAEDIEVGRIYQSAKEMGRQVTITTYESLLRGLTNGTINPKDFECLILDEAHKALSDKRINALKLFDHAIQFGFTATPDYSEQKKVSKILPNKIHEMSTQEAVDAELISPTSVILAKVDIDLSEVTITNNGEYDEALLSRAINITSQNKAAVQLYEEMFMGKKAIAYCAGVDHAQALAEFFNSKGIQAGVIFGKQSLSEQKRIKDLYKKGGNQGGFDVICNADILIEGFDEPSASVCLNLRPTASPVVAEQRAGRISRINPEDPDKFAYVVDFVYPDTRNKFKPIFYSDIIDGSVVLPKSVHKFENLASGNTRTWSGIQIEGIKINVEHEEVMRITREKTNTDSALDGWVTTQSIAKEVGATEATILSIFNDLLESNQSFLTEYADQVMEIQRGRGKARYFGSELASKIKDLYRVKYPRHEGYVNPTVLAQSMDALPKTITSLVARFLEQHPEFLRDNPNELKTSTKGEKKITVYGPKLVEEIKRLYALERPNLEGWVRPASLAVELGVSPERFERVLSRYRTAEDGQNNEWAADFYTFPVVKKKGTKELISPRLKEEISRQIDVRDVAPEGWLTVNGIHTGHGVSDSVARKVIAKYRSMISEHPEYAEWFKTYRTTTTGHPVEHLHPDLVSRIIKEASRPNTSRGDWTSVSALAKRLNIHPATLKGILNRYRVQPDGKNQEWVGDLYRVDQLSRWGSSRELISSRLAAEIESQFADRKTDMPVITKDEKVTLASEGWLTANGIHKLVGISDVSLKNLISKYRAKIEDHPEYAEWFKRMKEIGAGRILEYYHPELVQRIIADYSAVSPAPDGWISVAALVSSLGTTSETLIRRINALIANNPDLESSFRVYKTKSGVQTFYMSDQLVQRLTSERQAITTAPEGWMTRDQLSRQVGLSAGTVKKYVREYRGTHPDWFAKYILHQGKSEVEYFSPDLVEEIIKRVEKLPPRMPEGWFTIGSLAASLGVAGKTIGRRIDELRAMGELSEEDFRPHFSDTGVHQSISPYLADRIREMIRQKGGLG